MDVVAPNIAPNQKDENPLLVNLTGTCPMLGDIDV